MTGILLIAAFGVGMGWVVSGKSPFVMLILIGVHCESARIVGLRALGLAWRYFSENYRAVVRVRKLEAF